MPVCLLSRCLNKKHSCNWVDISQTAVDLALLICAFSHNFDTAFMLLGTSDKSKLSEKCAILRYFLRI